MVFGFRSIVGLVVLSLGCAPEQRRVAHAFATPPADSESTSVVVMSDRVWVDGISPPNGRRFQSYLSERRQRDGGRELPVEMRSDASLDILNSVLRRAASAGYETARVRVGKSETTLRVRRTDTARSRPWLIVERRQKELLLSCVRRLSTSTEIARFTLDADSDSAERARRFLSETCGAELAIVYFVVPAKRATAHDFETLARVVALLPASARPATFLLPYPPGYSLDGAVAKSRSEGSPDPTKLAPLPDARRGKLPKEVIRRTLREASRILGLCYADGLEWDENLRGVVRTRFVIAEDGSVTDIGADRSDMPDRAVIDCTLEVLKGLRFPRPEGGAVAVSYPILFDERGPRDMAYASVARSAWRMATASIQPSVEACWAGVPYSAPGTPVPSVRIDLIVDTWGAVTSASLRSVADPARAPGPPPSVGACLLGLLERTPFPPPESSAQSRSTVTFRHVRP
jgi:hypothetical protein